MFIIVTIIHTHTHCVYIVNFSVCTVQAYGGDSYKYSLKVSSVHIVFVNNLLLNNYSIIILPTSLTALTVVVF